MSWQLLLGVSILLYSFSVILQKILLKNDKSDPISFSIFFQFGVALVIGILVLILQGKLLFPKQQPISLNIFLMSILYGLATLFVFKSLKVIEASRFTVIFSSRALFAVLGVSFFFRENLTSIQWIGAILIILGVGVVSFKSMTTKIGRGDLFAILAAILFGLASTNDRLLIKFFDPYTYVVVVFLFPGLAEAVMYPKKLLGLKIYFQKHFLFKMIILCFLYGVSAVTFYAALQETPNSSQLFSINAFSGILTVVLSILILKEKDNVPQKIIGAVVSVLGLLLVNG